MNKKSHGSGHRYKFKKRFFVILMIVAVLGGLGAYRFYNHLIGSRSSVVDHGGNYEQGLEIMLGAKAYINSGLVYSDKYYSGGYPPAHIGVCTDVLWRGLSKINVTFKDLVDEDTKNNFAAYKDVISYRDTGLDFRSVPVVRRYLKMHAVSLTIDPSNLLAWQPGDIAVYGNNHVAIVSCLRNLQGYPYVIQHGKDPAGDEDRLINDDMKLTDHFRWNQVVTMQGD